MKRPVIFSLLAMLVLAAPLSARELSLAYFMGAPHPMNAAVFTPFSERVAELSGGQLTIKHYPGGALNSVPPKQYSIVVDGVADIAFALPGYTGEIFPMTNVIGLPGLCATATECTQALIRAREALETEYDAKLLAIWSNAPPVLITRDRAVRSLEDMRGLTLRVASRQEARFVAALGASAVAQPVDVIQQNLANGVIDGIVIDPSGIASFQLFEAGKYVTDWFPGSGTAFVLLMNRDTYNSLSPAEKGWIDTAADEALMLAGAAAYDRAGAGGMKAALEKGMEIITLSDEAKASFEAAITPALAEAMTEAAGMMRVGDVVGLMTGK